MVTIDDLFEPSKSFSDEQMELLIAPSGGSRSVPVESAPAETAGPAHARPHEVAVATRPSAAPVVRASTSSPGGASAPGGYPWDPSTPASRAAASAPFEVMGHALEEDLEAAGLRRGRRLVQGVIVLLAIGALIGGAWWGGRQSASTPAALGDE